MRFLVVYFGSTGHVELGRGVGRARRAARGAAAARPARSPGQPRGDRRAVRGPGPRPRPAPDGRAGRRRRAHCASFSTRSAAWRDGFTDRPDECQEAQQIDSTSFETSAVIAQRHRGVRADEDAARVAAPLGPRARITGSMTSRCSAASVDDRPTLLKFSDEHDGRLLARQSSPHRSLCSSARPGARPRRLRRRRGRRVVHQHRRGERVVLGLADEFGRDMHRIGGVVGEYRDLGRAGFGVDADDAAPIAWPR